MKTPRRRRFAMSLLFFVVAAGVALWLNGDYKRSLVAALGEAGRVAVSEQGYGGGEEPVAFVMEGRSKVEQRLGALAFERRLFVVSFCRCRGDTSIDVFEGESKLVTLTYHHGTHVRWRDGPWGTDVFLTPDAQVRLDAWLKDEGYDRLELMHQERLAEEN